MLTTKLLSFTLLGAEWILWILVALSILSVTLVIERIIFFTRNRVASPSALSRGILAGELERVRREVGSGRGLEACVIRDGLSAAELGPETVEQILAATMARERKRYERGLTFLGTLGNNAPFIGLFGTVLGIIRAFHDLAASNGAAGKAAAAAGAASVMSGISEALVATAVGLFVALPAVVAFNGFNRWLKSITTSATELGHAIVAHLRASEVN